MTLNHVLAGTGAVAFLALARLLWMAGRRLAGTLGKGAGEGVAALALLGTAGTVLLVNWFPLAVPVWVWTGPACYLEQAAYALPATLFFGLAGARLPEPRQARSVGTLAGVVAIVAGAHLFLAVLAREHTGLPDRPFDGPVCRQSTGWSCGPAACATMLKARGIPATEREMAELSLTYVGRGTTLPRFVRGLALKARKEGLDGDLVVRDHLTAEDLEAFPVPCVVALRWSLLVDHAVCLFGRDERGRYLVGEVTAGVTQPWNPEEFHARFLGTAITFVPRGR